VTLTSLDYKGSSSFNVNRFLNISLDLRVGSRFTIYMENVLVLKKRGKSNAEYNN